MPRYHEILPGFGIVWLLPFDPDPEHAESHQFSLPFDSDMLL